MTLWFQLPAMLAAQSDEELVRMKNACRLHRRKFEKGPEQERQDAERMFMAITAEQRRRQNMAAMSLVSGRQN